jgi:uncharacterized protein (UPF0332 family)
VTDENRARNLKDELERAAASMQASDALQRLGLHADAVSRAYYAAFHALRALLLSRGVEPRSHSAAIHLFNVELVRTGRFDSSWNRLLGGLQRTRELADYDAAVMFSAEDAEAEVEAARRFLEAARAFLRAQGFGA